MTNLTSSLTLKLTDGLSGPAKQAADSLKGLGLSAQQLNAAVKFDGLRQAQANFRQTATAFEAARVNVRKLAQDFAAADAPTKQMAKALQQARAQASAAGQTFQQQSAVFRQARVDMQQLGVPLNQVATEEQRLKSAVQATTAAMVQQAQQARTLGARIRAGAGRALGNIAPFLGPPMLGAAYKAVKAGAAIDTAETGLRAAGISASEIESVSSIVLAQQARFPQLPINEILDRYKEERSITSSPAEAQRMLPVIAQTMAVLKTMGDGTTTGMGFMMKAAQGLGAAQNPARLTSFMEAYLKAKQVKGDFFTPDQMFSFFGGLKGSGALLSDRFLHTTAMSLAAELKSGGRAGTGIDQMVRGIVAPTGIEAKEFLKLGLMSPQDFETKGGRGGRGGGFREHPGSGGIRRGELRGAGGGVGEVKLDAHAAGWRLAQTDPDKWVQVHLLPALRQAGINDLPSQLAMVNKLFSGRSAEIVTKLITQAKEYEREAEKFREAHGFAATGDYATDAKFQLETLGTALHNFGGVLTDPIMHDAARGMNFMTRTVAEWAKNIGEWNAKNPTLAKFAGPGAVGALGASGLVATYYGLIRPLMGGFGLKSSAIALDGSAAALTRAAMALGGSSIVGGGAGAAATKAGAKAVAGGVAKNLLMGAGIAGTALAIDSAIYDNLPQETKDDLARREDAMNAVKPTGPMSKAEILRRAANSDRARQRIAPIGDFTIGAGSGFRLDAGPTRPGFAPLAGQPETKFVKPSPALFGGSITPNFGIPQSGLRLPPPSPAAELGIGSAAPSPQSSAAPITPPSIENRELDARAAGQAFGKAFREAAVDEIRAAVSETDVLINKIIGLMTFSANPDVSPQGTSPSGPAPFGPHGDLLHGGHSDFGIAP